MPTDCDAANFPPCHLDRHSRYATTTTKRRLAGGKPSDQEDAHGREMHRVKIAPKGMGLNDFVAMQEGFFAAEGLDVEFDWKTFRGTQSSWKGSNYLERPQDQPYTKDKAEVIQGACVWGSDLQRLRRHGQIRGRGLRRSRPGRSSCGRIRRSASREDLKDVPIAVGMRAGSHFNVPYRLEKYLPLANIKTVNTGGFGARLKALLDGEVEAASLLPPQIAMAEQLGLRKIIEDTFHTLWWVPEGFAAGGRHRLSARARSRREGDGRRSRQISAAVEARGAGRIRELRTLGFLRNSAAASASSTRRIPRAEFDEVMDQVKRWGLDQYLKDSRPLTNLAAEGGGG